VTGAGGFVGRKLAQELYNTLDGVELTLMDVSFGNDFPIPESEHASNPTKTVRYVEGQLQDASVREAIVQTGLDIIYHLAAVPGGAAEKNPMLSRAVNLDATLSLADLVAEKGEGKTRFVYTSTIGVYADDLPEFVDDTTPAQPEMVYGCHKAMVELALANMHLHGLLDVVAVRLSGIVARPRVASGLKSAFLSDVFHALKAGEAFVCPLAESATTWMLSASQCVSNLVLAGTKTGISMPKSRVVTLPVVHCTMLDLIDEILLQVDSPTASVRYEPQPEVEGFGKFPPLVTNAADIAGFSSDGSVQSLVKTVLASLA